MAYARYVDAAQTHSYTGQLHLSTSEAFSDHDQMFAAGYLEGYMTAGTDCYSSPTATIPSRHLHTDCRYSFASATMMAGRVKKLLLPSAGRIHEYYSNTYTYFTQGMNASLEEPLDWLEKQDRWARSQVLQPVAPCINCLLTGSIGLLDLKLASSRNASLRSTWVDLRAGWPEPQM